MERDAAVGGPPVPDESEFAVAGYSGGVVPRDGESKVDIGGLANHFPEKLGGKTPPSFAPDSCNEAQYPDLSKIRAIAIKGDASDRPNAPSVNDNTEVGRQLCGIPTESPEFNVGSAAIVEIGVGLDEEIEGGGSAVAPKVRHNSVEGGDESPVSQLHDDTVYLSRENTVSCGSRHLFGSYKLHGGSWTLTSWPRTCIAGWETDAVRAVR